MIELIIAIFIRAIILFVWLVLLFFSRMGEANIKRKADTNRYFETYQERENSK